MSLNKLGGRIGREDTITYEDALKRFNDFYNDPSRNKTDIGRLRRVHDRVGQVTND